MQERKTATKKDEKSKNHLEKVIEREGESVIRMEKRKEKYQKEQKREKE